MNYRETNIIILIICCLFLFISCREIITPVDSQKKTTNLLNNPIESETPNSYTFKISARNNSSNYINAIPVLQYLDLSLAVGNYNSGTVHIQLVNNAQEVVYDRTFNFGFPSSTVNLDRLVPNKVKLEFDNFSGDFSLNLNGNP